MAQGTWLTIGKITGVHGLAGNLKVWSYAESPDTFEEGLLVELRDEGAKAGKEYTITKASERKKGILLGLKGITTREASELLVGKEILVDKDKLPELDDDTWYWEDLYGLTVTDKRYGTLGQVERLFSTGADDILVVTENAGGKNEVLIPMNAYFVTTVDIDAGRISTDLPEGFILD